MVDNIEVTRRRLERLPGCAPYEFRDSGEISGLGSPTHPPSGVLGDTPKFLPEGGALSGLPGNNDRFD